MSFRQNILKQERIDRFGITADLPLFNQPKEVPAKFQNLPTWIWNGREVSKEALLKFEKHFADKEVQYLNAVLTLGGEATDNEVVEFLDWYPGYVSARRNALMKAGIIVSYPDSKDQPRHKISASGVKNIIWYVNFKKLYMLTLD